MSGRRIIWAPATIADLEEAYEFIRADSLSRADTWRDKVFQSVEKLAVFPKMGRVTPEIGQSRYRELIFGEYRLFHEVREKEIYVFRLLHSKRRFSI